MDNIFRCRKMDDGNKPTRYYSDIQEKSVAKSTGGRQTKNSGATMFQKEDVLSDDWSYECKTCTKKQKSFSLKEDWFKKSIDESAFMGKKYNAIVFNFGPNEPNYYVISEQIFNLMREALKEVEI